MSVLTMDCVTGMRMMADCSVDAVVTDPPYELGFMGKSWDASGIAYSVEMWREALRVLKPGGHLLAFSGSRTYHRMVCAIEDAGFEVRDQIMWVYGSGFPKSLNVSKALDAFAKTGRSDSQVTGDGRSRVPGQHYKEFRKANAPKADFNPTDAAAIQWDGWGTALKPAHEPICVARKPLIGTVAANVLAHGTGALNIDGCRVATDDNLNGGTYSAGGKSAPMPGDERTGAALGMFAPGARPAGDFVQPDGRWPANLIHDGSDEVVSAFPDAKGQQGDLKGHSKNRVSRGIFEDMNAAYDALARVETEVSAARFFYCAKASKKDRGEGNTHPTVKPTELMAYLCRLVTPPGGTILDPFAGSGSTGRAAKREGFNFLGFELSAEYAAIANARIKSA